MAMKKEYITESLADTAAVTITAGVIAGFVGYREQSGKPQEELMPHLGPVPMDLGIGVLGHLIGFAWSGASGPSMATRVFNKIGDGGFAVFGVSAGQSAGASLYDSMKSKGGGGRVPPRPMPAPGGVAPGAAPASREYRGQDGRMRAQPAAATGGTWERQAA
jgi:hypothetical protein